MARKKQEIALQVEIETQEEWEEMLAKEGLTVVDVYQEWCGPCTAMLSNFKRLKNELGDDLLHFSVAKADTVDCLEKYRGKCEPNFLFFAGGVLVATVRGANTPHMNKALVEQLKTEHKVLEGQQERKEIRDPFLSDLDDRQKTVTGDEDDEDEEVEQRRAKSPYEQEEGETNKGITVAIIKPDLVAAGKVDEIKQKMSEAGIEILEATDRTLTEEEAREFYKHKQDEEFFEDLVKFMSSGPSHVLVLTKGDTGDTIIDEWRDLLGPAQVEKAKEEAPESLRAQYGTENYVNALHGSDSNETAMGELAFFFPSFSVPKVQKPGAKPKIQRTLALIRPEAMAERKDEILQKIQESGFTIAMQKEIRLSKEQAEEFYKEHQGQEYFDTLTTKMSSGPLLALALAREDAVTGWRDMLGPKEVPEAKEKQPQSLRAQFSQDDDVINPLHGSDSASNAEKELDYFFPMQQTVAVVKPDAYQTKEEIMAKIKEAGFNIAARKETEISKEVAEQFYKDVNDKEYYGDLIEHMTSGPSLFMVLSREDAVDGWRSIIGPTDPAQAKEQNPDSLRAQFGTDAKANAVHGSSNPESAKESIKLVFGDMEFNKDGTVKGGDTQREQTRENTQAEGEGQEEQTEQTTQNSGEEQNKDDTAEADESEQQQQQGEGQAETREGGDQTTQDDRPPSAKSQTAQEGDRPASSKSQAQAAEGDRPATAKSQTQADRPASAKSQTQASRPATAKSQTQAAEETQSVQKENTTVSKENTAVSKENTTVSKENTTVSGDNKQEADDTKADDQNKTDDTKEGEQQADETKPSTPPADDQKASEEHAADDQKPAEDDQKPAEDDQKPAENDQKPAEDGQKPAEGQASTEEAPAEQTEEPKADEGTAEQTEEPAAASEETTEGGDKKEDEAPKKEGDQQQEQT